MGPQLGDMGDDSQTAFLRTRLKLRCIERASKVRDRAVQKKRVTMRGSENGSDEMEMDEDVEDDDGMFDEVRYNLMFSMKLPLTKIAAFQPNYAQHGPQKTPCIHVFVRPRSRVLRP